MNIVFKRSKENCCRGLILASRFKRYLIKIYLPSYYRFNTVFLLDQNMQVVLYFWGQTMKRKLSLKTMMRIDYFLKHSNIP